MASWQGRSFGLIAPGYEMARVCAAHLMGKTEPVFTGGIPSTKLKLLGVEVASIGDAHGRTPDSISCVVDDPVSGEYRKLVMDMTGTRLLGAVLVGNTSSFGMLDQYYSNQLSLPAQPAALRTLYEADVIAYDDECADSLICLARRDAAWHRLPDTDLHSPLALAHALLRLAETHTCVALLKTRVVPDPGWWGQVKSTLAKAGVACRLIQAPFLDSSSPAPATPSNAAHVRLKSCLRDGCPNHRPKWDPI